MGASSPPTKALPANKCRIIYSVIVYGATAYPLLTGKFLEDRTPFGTAILKVIKDVSSLGLKEVKGDEFCYSPNR